MAYGKKLQKIQQITKKTQTELATFFGVSFPTFNSWLHEKSTPRKNAQTSINQLYNELTGNVEITTELIENELLNLKNLKKKYPKPLSLLLSRKDLYDIFVLELTYHSNSIEGSTFDEPDVRAVLFDGVTIPDKTLVEHQEVKNHQSATGHVLKWLQEGEEKITEEFILRLHSILMNGILMNAGQYRNHSVRIAGSKVPTTNHLNLKRDMDNLFKDINRQHKQLKHNNDSYEIIKHIAKTHAKFEKIHPFSDGNGRIGRLLMVVQAIRHGLAPILIKQQKKIAYYKHIEEAKMNENYATLTAHVLRACLDGYDLLN